MPAKANVKPSRGSLEDKPFPILLCELYRGRSSGTVVLRRDETVKEIYFEKGHVKFATSNDPDERFGQILCRTGKLTIGQLEYALESAKKQEGRLGKVLVEAGFLKPPDLFQALREQIKEIVVGAFPWASGTFEVTKGNPRAGEAVKLSMDVGELIRQGMRRISDPMLLMRGIGSMDTVLTMRRDAMTAVKEFRPGSKEQRILQMAKGGVRLRDMCNTLPYPAVETCQLVYGLLVFGVLEKKETL
ncbi:MAG: DUF4388 domain-containing protein [Acidobacteriota bacterium]|nr:MAG: DUF4388 domain-containing protein [Acidobacteriota bacterium]